MNKQSQASIVFCKIVLFFAIILLVSAGQSFAQFCTGLLSYLIRDETGVEMTASQLEKVTLKQIDGYEAVKEKNEQGQFSYRVQRNSEIIKIDLTNPLHISASCGSIVSATFQYAAKTMMLFFDNRDRWSGWEVDSLPFRNGTFQLKKISDGTNKTLRCNEISQPKPAVRRCSVPSADWQVFEY